jgi:hypothetical protein
MFVSYSFTPQPYKRFYSFARMCKPPKNSADGCQNQVGRLGSFYWHHYWDGILTRLSTLNLLPFNALIFSFVILFVILNYFWLVSIAIYIVLASAWLSCNLTDNLTLVCTQNITFDKFVFTKLSNKFDIRFLLVITFKTYVYKNVILQLLFTIIKKIM